MNKYPMSINHDKSNIYRTRINIELVRYLLSPPQLLVSDIAVLTTNPPGAVRICSPFPKSGANPRRAYTDYWFRVIEIGPCSLLASSSASSLPLSFL